MQPTGMYETVEVCRDRIVSQRIVRGKRSKELKLLPLLESDRLWFKMPIEYGASLTYSYILAASRGLAERLEKSLERLLSSDSCWTFLSGRYCPEKLGVYSVQAGVPFTVLEMGRTLDPELDIDGERLLYETSDIRDPYQVFLGEQPLVTVSLAFFNDDVAVLSISAVRAILDDLGLVRFVDDWARDSCREKRQKIRMPASLEKRRIRQENTFEADENEQWEWSQALTHDLLNEIIDPGFARLNESFFQGLEKYSALTTACSPDWLFETRHHEGGFVDFTRADISILKSRAQSASAQIAVLAHLLQSLWRLCSDKSKPESNAIVLSVSGRRILERHQSDLDYLDEFGDFTYLHRIPITANLESATLAEIAAQIHLEPDPNDLAHRLLSFENQSTGCLRYVEDIGNYMDDSSVGYLLKINDFSQVPLPDFGPGSVTKRILVTAGPQPLIATPSGGLRCYLQPSSFSEETTAADLQDFIKLEP